MTLVDFFDTNVDQIDTEWRPGRIDGSSGRPYPFWGTFESGDQVCDGLCEIKS